MNKSEWIRKKYIDVYFERWCNGERQFQCVNERTVFDSCEIDSIFRTGAIQGSEVMQIRKMIVDGIKNRCGQELDDSAYSDITTIQFDREKVDLILAEMGDECVSQAHSVSGDDDVYDYFPDLVGVFEQACVYFDEKKLYNDFVKKINHVLEYEKDDEGYFEEI